MESILPPVFVAAASYLIGSFPTAYVLVRRGTRKDLRREGSGNIGTLNAFEVTRSKSIGAAVLLIDLVKGALPQLLLLALPGYAQWAGLALLGVVAGHNYSPWIGWKGGRGLAPAAGASALFAPMFLALWGLYWLAAFWRTRDVHFANIAATLFSPFTVLLAPQLFAYWRVHEGSDAVPFTLALFLLGGLVMLRHAGPLRDLMRRRTGGREPGGS